MPRDSDFNAIQIHCTGKAYFVPFDAVFTLNNAELEVFAPNFHVKLDLRDIQEIRALDQDKLTPGMTSLLAALPKSVLHLVTAPSSRLGQENPNNRENSSPKSEKKENQQKPEVELRSGVI